MVRIQPFFMTGVARDAQGILRYTEYELRHFRRGYVWP